MILFAQQESHHRHMKYEIKLAGIERKLPKQFKLPATFHAFVEACGNFQRGDLGWFAIKYTGTKDLIGFDAKDSLVPALRLPDGGFVEKNICLGDKSLYRT